MNIKESPMDVIKSHECEILEKYNRRLKKKEIGIQKLDDDRWYLMFWSKKENTANGIVYCPYCGEKLS